MDAKKFEGYAWSRTDADGGLEWVFVPDQFIEDADPATLVLGKAYTKEEVEAILREAISKTNDRGAVDVLTIINIAERNGLTL